MTKKVFFIFLSMNLDLNNSQSWVWGSLALTFPSQFANPLMTILIRTEGKKLGKLKCMELLQLIKRTLWNIT